MSQSLQNQMTLAKSMNSIITLDDGAGTIITNGTINSNNIFGNTITGNTFSANDLDLNGSLTLEVYNDISVSTTGGSQLVSLYEKGESYFAQDVHLNKAFGYTAPTTGYELCNKTYVDSVALGKPITTVTTDNRILTWGEVGYIAINDTGTSISNVYLPEITSPTQYGQTFVFYLTNGSANVINVQTYFNGTLYQYISYSKYPNEQYVSFNGSLEVFISFSITAVDDTMGGICWQVTNYDLDPYYSYATHYGVISFARAGPAMYLGVGSEFTIAGSVVVTKSAIVYLIQPDEIACLSGVTANIQDQINLLSNITPLDNVFTGTNEFQKDVSLTTNASLQVTTPAVTATIANQYFQTPVVTNATAQIFAYPYTAITGWNFSNPATPVDVVIARGSTLWNSSTFIFPYTGFTQYLSFSFLTGVSTLDMMQDITFSEIGDYLLTYYTLGVGGASPRFSPSEQSITSNIAGVSLLATTSESVWCYQVSRFRITTAGVQTLKFTGTSNSTLANRAITIYGVRIKKCIGLNVSDSGLINNQLIAQDGITTTGIFNRGDVWNYGNTKLFGGLELYTRYANASILLSNSLYGSTASSTGGRTIAIGNSTIKFSVHIQDAILIGVEAGQNIGTGGTSVNASYAGANTGIIAIGYKALREFNGLVSSGSSSLQNIFIGDYAGQLLTIPSGIHQYNCVVGSSTFKRAGSTNLQYNAFFGHNIMGTTTTAVSTIQGNSVFGNNSFLLARGANNTSCGYNTFILGTNNGTNNNCFFGQSVCNTQSGATNVMANCSFFGSNTDVSVAGNYSNSTCLGYNSRITASNSIFLGTASETTYIMGGLNIPSSTVLTLLGNVSANSLTVTPTQLSFLNQVTANQIPTTAISGYGTFNSVATFNAVTTFTDEAIFNFDIFANGVVSFSNSVDFGTTSTIGANGYTITPDQLAFLSQVSAFKLPTATIEDMATRTPSIARALTFFGHLSGSTQLTTTTTGNHNVAIGTETLMDNDAGSYNTVVGSNAGSSHDVGDYCTYVGYNTGRVNTASNVTIIGADSCTTQTSIPNATIIGEGNSVANGNTNSVILGQGNTISGNNCGIIGYGITNSTANRIHIGNATQTVYIQNDLIVQDVLQTIGELQPTTILYKKYYVSTVSPTTLLNGNTITAPLYEYYKVNIGAGNLFLPLSSEVEIGTVLSFRRVTTVSGSLTVTVQTGSGQAILGRNSVTPVTSTVLINVAVYVSIIFLEANLWAILA